MENLGLTKNLLYGSLLGLICSAVLLFILNKFLFPDYLYLRDEMKQTSEGGALTLVAIYLCVVGALKPKEFADMSFGVGALVLLGMAFGGYLIPIFVLGALYIPFSITTGTSDLYNYIFEILGPFCMGGISVGLVAGAFHYKNPIKSR